MVGSRGLALAIALLIFVASCLGQPQSPSHGKKRQTSFRNQTEIEAVFSPCTDEATAWTRLSANLPGVDLASVALDSAGPCNDTRFPYRFYLSLNQSEADPAGTQNAYQVLKSRQPQVQDMIEVNLLPQVTPAPPATKGPKRSKPWIPVIIVLVIVLIVLLIVAAIVVYCTEKRKKEAQEVTSHNFH